METTRDCGDRICSLTFQIVETCALYIKTPEHKLCDVPCDVRDCKVEYYHEIQCPIWTCQMKPQTTTISPNTTLIPFPPEPTAGSDCSDAACITASFLAALFGLCFVTALIFLIRNRQMLRNMRARVQRYGFDDEERTPIFRRSQNLQNLEAGWENIHLGPVRQNETAESTV